MSGSGTDKTKSGLALAGPVVILVEPQLGENIGMAARAMGNFALSRLRIVNPRDGWPNVSAQRVAAGADHILDHVELFETVAQAVADCTLLFATTARAHDQAKPVVAPDAAAREIAAEIAGGGTVGILFGRERYGLQNEEVALASRIITFPVNPGFASLNLAQAVLLIGYEWFKLSTVGALPFAMPERSEPAAQHLCPDGPDQAGHAHLARRGDGDCGGAQGAGQGRRARWRPGDAAARAACRTRAGGA